MLRVVRHVRRNWTYRAYILCVGTAIINGMKELCPPLVCTHTFFRCIADNESECPACVREHGVIREIKLNNEKLVDQHEVFASEVQESGFSAIASAFSRGVLNNSRPEL